MKSLPIVTALAAFGFACCAHSQPTSAAPVHQSASSTTKGPASHSWMMPGASSGDLLYVTNANATVTVYSYPQGTLAGTLRGFNEPYGVCVDKNANVYVTDYGDGTISKFAHGGTKALATLKDTNYLPQGCAIDPTTGNLAVANYKTAWGYPGNLSVYRKAHGFPRSFIVENFYYYYFCAYDGAGNAYVDGQFGIYGENFEFAQLPKKGNTLGQILLPANIGFPGGIAWDGTNVAVGDQSSQNIYEFAIAKGKATLKNTTTLSGVGQIGQFAIDGSTLVAPSQFSGGGNVAFYAYPAGGSPTLTITDGVFYPRAVAISPGS